MVSIKKSNSSAASQSLKQSKISFATTKRSNSGHASAKGKKPPVRTGSAPVGTQQSKKQSPLSAGSASSDDDGEIDRVKRRKVNETTVIELAGDGLVKEEAVLHRPKLDHDDRKWSKIYKHARDQMGDNPVHSGDQTKVHHILRVFDLSYQYGPCIGVTRLERWQRAEALGLHPPLEIRDILMTQEGTDETDLKECVFYGDI